MSIIDIQGISKRYHATQALTNVTLQVETGEIYGFLGPNGAGKTTTIRAFMGFIKPDSGTIKIDGLDATTQAPKVQALVGYLPSEQQLYQKWSGAQHVRFYESLRGPSETVHALVNRLEFDLRIPVGQLSTGNKQKLALILAIMHTPRLLIMDEPTRGLDPLLQQEFYRILQEYRDDAKGTVFISSHNLTEVQKICSRVGIIRAGTLVASESVAAIRDMKMHIVTISFEKPNKQAEFVRHYKGESTIVNPHTVTLRIHGNLTTLIKQLSAYSITDLEITHASLEDIFLAYYQGDAT